MGGEVPRSGAQHASVLAGGLYERTSGAAGQPLGSYQRRAPERTVLHELVARHAQSMLAELRDADPDGGGLPRYVERELAAYLRCGVLAHGFTRVRCQTCHDEIVVAFSCKQIAPQGDGALAAAEPAGVRVARVQRRSHQAAKQALLGAGERGRDLRVANLEHPQRTAGLLAEDVPRGSSLDPPDTSLLRLSEHRTNGRVRRR